MQDYLIFNASWNGRPMVAKEVVELMREFLRALSRISSWEPPFDVSGSSMRLMHMPIKEDLSDFDEIVFKAMDDKKVRFFSDNRPDEMRIRPDSRTVYGMRATFSDYPQRTSKRNIVTVSIRAGSSDNSFGSGIHIKIPSYKPYIEENGIWAISDELEQPEAIFELLLDFCDPYMCTICSQEFLSDITDREIDINSPIGWMSYSRNPKIITALKDDPRASDFKGGILIKLGDNVSVFEDSMARKAAIEIRDKLRAADATNWMEGAEHTRKPAQNTT